MEWSQWSHESPAHAADLDAGGSIDFLCRDWEDCLLSFDVAQPLEKIHEQLTVYSDFLRRNYSLAVARGAILPCMGVSNRLADLFSTPSPAMIEGAPVTWVELILSLGPAPTVTQLASIQSRIQLASQVQDLIRSGRPWRFLSPWPGNEDCDQEWQALQVTREELTCINRIACQVCESIPSVIEQIERRKALVRRMDVDPSTAGIRSPWLPDAAAPSESRALSPSPIPAGANENETTTAAASLSSSSRAALSSAPSSSAPSSSAPSSHHGDGSPSLVSFQSTPSVQKRKHRGMTGTKTFIENLRSALDEPADAKALFWSKDGKSFVAHQDLFSPALLAHLETSCYDAFV